MATPIGAKRMSGPDCIPSLTRFLCSQRKIKHRTKTPQGDAWFCPRICDRESIPGKPSQNSRKKMTESNIEASAQNASLTGKLRFKRPDAKSFLESLILLSINLL